MLKHLHKHFSLGMAILLLFSFVPMTYADTSSAIGKNDLKSSSPELLSSKIDDKITSQFKDDKFVTYLVKMKEQTDTNAVANSAIQKALTSKASPSAAKMTARTSVVSSLRETASRTQVGIENLLEQQLKSGEVKEYKSFFIVNALAVTSTKSVLDQIALLPEVDKILPNEERFLDKVVITKQPQDTQTKDSTAAASQTISTSKAEVALAPSSIEWNIDQINAPAAWAQGIDGTGIVVANLDSGVEYTHPALQRKWRALDASGNIVNPELSWYDAHSHTATLPADTDGHGTHTMGTMVGSEVNGSNQIGVAPGAKWIAVRIFNPSTTDAIILDAGQWLLAPVDKDGNLHPELAPDVVNNSWGGGPGLDEWFRPIVQAWRDAQIFPEFSAGNTTFTNPGGPGSVANPANYPESFATGATDINRNLASFSLLGPSPYGEIKPEVSAPGVNIRSSVPGGAYEGGWNGTSMAGPHTTALAALLLQANHSLSVDDLEEILTSTATPRTDSQYSNTPNNGYGYGIINAEEAVNSVIQGVGTVSGKVVTAGDDLEEPVLSHTPPAFLYKGFDTKLTAQVSDDVSITAVDFYAREKGTSHYLHLPTSRISGTSKDGIYQATVPAFLLEVTGLEYYITVNDYGNNGFNSDVYSVTVSAGIQPDHLQDFETDDTGFISGGTGNTWGWGIPNSGPGSAYSGEKVVATNLTGTYAASANSYLAAPPIDLTGSPEGAILSFKHWYDLENTYDIGTLYLATEDSEYVFEPIATFTGNSNGWKTHYVNLQPYAGQQVYIQFGLTSDSSVQKAGWYIDDFAIQLPDETAPAAPTELTGTVNNIGNVSLTWTAPLDEDIQQYHVYRSSTSGSDFEDIGTTLTPSYTDTGTPSSGTYYYTVTASDFSGNESAYSNEIALQVERPVTIFSDSFDGSDDNGWTHQGTQDEWERGAPITGPTGAVSAPNVWATDLDNTYNNSAEYALNSPVIDLADVAAPITLNFDHWYEIETNYDSGYVEITSDGGSTWTELGKFSHSSNGKQWSPVYYSLDTYAGNEVQVRFRLKTDSSVAKLGWYIDNFQVLGIAAPEVTKSSTLEPSTIKNKELQEASPFKLIYTSKSDYTTAIEQIKNEGDVGLNSLPASATVTVVETGRSVQTDPATGRYTLNHVAGSYTLKAEAYGYYPETQSVTINDTTATKANFNLQAIPKGLVTGVITDERSGQPIANAKISVVENGGISPLETNEDGTFSLQLFEGTYTISVSAQDYYKGTTTVTVPANGTVETSIALKPFIGFPGEIGYDDGTPENARTFNAANNAWAVKMTPEADAAQVTGISIRFWNAEWPVPGGTAFKYAVYDASGANGAPGQQLAGPFDGTALRNDQWTTLELPEPVNVEGDFYIVYIQTLAGTSAPGLATDENGTNALRSWQRVSGTWSQSPASEGNYMIRSIVRYPVNAPVLTSPLPDSYTNQSHVTITGTSPANDATIQLYKGTELISTTTVVNGEFSVSIELSEGVNTISAEAVVQGKSTDRSQPLDITLDTSNPVIDVISPLDGTRTNLEVLNVTGTVTDDYLDSLTINGSPIELSEGGAFAYRTLIQAGENVITLAATDLAGNLATVTRAVYVDLALPEITNLLPAEDVHLSSGDTLSVSFDSAPGLQASLRIELPLSIADTGRTSGLQFIEPAPGHYEASYTIPASLQLSGAVIVVKIQDAAGNTGEFQAAGRLFVSAPGENTPPPSNNVSPNAVIKAVNTAKTKKQVDFDGSRSSDSDGRIVRYSWQFGDGSTAAGAKVKHKYDKTGTYSVQLTVIDNQGAEHTATHKIVIK